MNKTPNHKKGFTLIEMIVATAISSMSVYAVTQSSVNFLKGYYCLSAHSTQSMQTNRVLDNIGFDIRMAASTAIEQESRLTVTTIDEDSYTYYTTDVEGVSTLMKRDNTQGTTATLAQYVSDFSVTHPGGNTAVVQLDATLNKDILGGVNTTETVSVRYTMRN